jgi:hypothetical protein
MIMAIDITTATTRDSRQDEGNLPPTFGVLTACHLFIRLEYCRGKYSSLIKMSRRYEGKKCTRDKICNPAMGT